MAPTYTTQADFEDYVPGWVTDNPAALDDLLQVAERDIDNLLGNRPALDATGLKLDPTALVEWQKLALNRATCAQAEFLFTRGPKAGIVPQASKVKGPDFEADYSGTPGGGANPQYAPKALRELQPLRPFLSPTGARARP